MFVFRLYVPLPKLTPEGYRVFVFRIFDSSLASTMSTLHLLKSVQMLMDWNMKQDKHKAAFVLFDVQNISLAFIRVGFKVMRKLLAIETVYPFLRNFFIQQSSILYMSNYTSF